MRTRWPSRRPRGYDAFSMGKREAAAVGEAPELETRARQALTEILETDYQRGIVRLRYEERRSWPEVAAALGREENAVRQEDLRIRRKLLRRLVGGQRLAWFFRHVLGVGDESNRGKLATLMAVPLLDLEDLLHAMRKKLRRARYVARGPKNKDLASEVVMLALNLVDPDVIAATTGSKTVREDLGGAAHRLAAQTLSLTDLVDDVSQSN